MIFETKSQLMEYITLNKEVAAVQVDVLWEALKAGITTDETVIRDYGMECENMNVVFCVMKDKELFAIYSSMKLAKTIAKRMTEKYGEPYHAATRVVFENDSEEEQCNG